MGGQRTGNLHPTVVDVSLAAIPEDLYEGLAQDPVRFPEEVQDPGHRQTGLLALPFEKPALLQTIMYPLVIPGPCPGQISQQVGIGVGHVDRGGGGLEALE